jgi:XRE family transcriptional regulator of biofilm formation
MEAGHAPVGERIRQRREEVGLTLSGLAEKAHVAKGYLWSLEHNQVTSRPSGETLYRIADALGTSMSDLLGRTLLVDAPHEVPPSLEEFAKEAKLSQRDVRMLAGVNFRGQQPDDKAGWEFIWRAIKASVDQ